MPASPPVAVAAVLLTSVAGGLVGAITRRWLAWLRRGAGVPLPRCVLGTGLLWAGVAAGWASGVVPGSVVGLLLGLGWLAVAGSMVDVAVHRLPDALTLPAAPAALALLAPLGWAAVTRGALAALVLCAAHAVVRLVAPAAMGGGDVKLAASTGAALGGVSWGAVVLGTVLAAAFTAAAPALYPVAARSGAAPRQGAAGERALPHGPSMLVACLVVVATAAMASPGPVGPG